MFLSDRLRVRFAACPLVLLLASVAGSVPQAQKTHTVRDAEFYHAKYPRAETVLGDLCEIVKSQGDEAAREFADFRGVRYLNGLPRLCLDMLPEFPDPTDAIEALGGSVLRVYADQGVVDCLIPPTEIARLQELRGVKFVRQPHWLQEKEAGPYHGEGVNAIGAHDWHLQGRKGAGHNIVVLDSGFTGVAVARAEGGIPAALFADKNFRADGDFAVTVHGTGCAEIVHEFAPDAAIGLVAVSTEAEFVDAVKWIRGVAVAGHPAHGFDIEIISCSLGYEAHRALDGTCPLCLEANAAWGAGVFFVAAAGNEGDEHWEGPWADADGDDSLEFAGVDESQSLVFGPGPGHWETVAIIWKDPWAGTVHNLDLIVQDGVGNRVAADFKEEPLFGLHPSAVVTFGIPTIAAGGSLTYHVFVTHEAGAGAIPDVEMHATQALQHQVAAGSVICPANHVNVEAVGTMDHRFYNAGGPLESWSSRGPNNAGAVKPDIVAPHKNSGHAYGFRNERSSGFPGTSAAAPHVAGIVAILMCDGDTTPAQAKADLHAMARLGDGQVAVPDNNFGHGLADLGDVLPRKTFSIGHTEQTNAPRAFSAADIIEEAWIDGDPYAVLKIPQTNLDGLALDLELIDNVNALSLNTEIGAANPVFFSVSYGSVGILGTAVRAQSALLLETAAADVFHSVKAGGNLLTSDGDGVPGMAALLIGNSLIEVIHPGDDLDALDMEDADPEMNWNVEKPLYICVDSATATALGVSAADIFRVTAAGPALWADAALDLNLMIDDDIDALVVEDLAPVGEFDPGDRILFSLAPGSPTLAAIPANPSDILTLNAAGFPVVDTAAANIGLLVADNLNALDISDTVCIYDLNQDGVVNINDVFVLLGQWGPAPPAVADFTGDGVVDLNDVFALLANWGPCP